MRRVARGTPEQHGVPPMSTEEAVQEGKRLLPV